MNMGVKIAIAGKGGVGKTTVCAIWAQIFADDGFDVWAIDADPSVGLCSALGIPSEKSPQPLIEMKQLIAERTGTGKDAMGAYFRLNPKVSDLPEKYALKLGKIKLLVLGGITQGGAGCACPEGAFLKALLSHLVLQRQEVVLVDLAAGPEFLGRASIKGIDALAVVVEPSSRSTEVATNIARMGKQLAVKHVVAIANKITDAGQLETIKSQLPGIPILADIEYNPGVQQADLDRKNIFEASSRLVEQLQDAKNTLTNLILSSAGIDSK